MFLTLDIGVLSELKMVDFNYFHFLSHFYFAFLFFFGLRVRINTILHMAVTNCHTT